jgi:pimeloyl-ACP methyl ester carboxylesterase
MEITTSEGRFTADVAGPADGPLVLLLHGFPQTRYTWRDVVPQLAAAGFRAAAVDQRGYSPGVRPSTVEAYAATRLVADVLDLADSLGAARFHLVGHDWGGQVAWLTAAHHGDRVVGLTVLSRPHPAAFARSFELDPEQAKRSQHHRNMGPEITDRWHADGSSLLRGVLTRAGVPASDIEAYLTVLGDRPALDAAMNWYRAADAAGGLRATADTPAVTGSVCYVWGAADQTVGRRAAELTAEHVTGPYRFVEIDGAGHFLTDDHGATVVRREIMDHVAATAPLSRQAPRVDQSPRALAGRPSKTTARDRSATFQAPSSSTQWSSTSTTKMLGNSVPWSRRCTTPM